MLSPSWFPFKNPLSHPHCFYKGAHPPTHSLQPHLPSIPIHWGIKSSQDQGRTLPLKPNKAILCYISSWSHGFPSVLFSWWLELIFSLPRYLSPESYSLGNLIPTLK